MCGSSATHSECALFLNSPLPIPQQHPARVTDCPHKSQFRSTVHSPRSTETSINEMSLCILARMDTWSPALEAMPASWNLLQPDLTPTSTPSPRCLKRQ